MITVQSTYYPTIYPHFLNHIIEIEKKTQKNVYSKVSRNTIRVLGQKLKETLANLTNLIINREKGDNGQFIIKVPKVL